MADSRYLYCTFWYWALCGGRGSSCRIRLEIHRRSVSRSRHRDDLCDPWGLRATIYNEVFQLFIIVLGLFPLLHRTSAGALGFSTRFAGSRGPLGLHLPLVSPAASLDRFGVVAGLGFVLSFSYWCTDFVLIQRALTTKTIAAGRLVPLLAGFGKLGFALLVIVPSLGAAAFLGHRMPTSFD